MPKLKKPWQEQFREYFDKYLKPKKPGIQNIDRELLTDFIIRVENEAVIRTEKAFGGCTKCYGKGYATERTGATARAPYSNLHLNTCPCDRGKQLNKIINSR